MPAVAPPSRGVNRTDGWRLSGFSLQGLGKGAGGNGIYLIQTSRAVVSGIARVRRLAPPPLPPASLPQS